MRIDLNPPLQRGIETEKSGKSLQSSNARASRANDDAGLSEDSVTLSSLATKALESSEVRQDKVDGLRQAIQNGQYSVDPQQVAEAMLNDVIK
jgi:flagellar biosynthesis anti-sigma factor FlgM